MPEKVKTQDQGITIEKAGKTTLVTGNKIMGSPLTCLRQEICCSLYPK